MKERPILMSAPMVRAILAGIKTQTRRAMKPLPAANRPHDVGTVWVREGDLHIPVGTVGHLTVREKMGLRCPYGQPGDRLWVRETFGHFERNDSLRPGDQIFYRAEGECLELQPWRPSIHMPRWASRITLEITGVRIERLQDISEADAKAEGTPGGHSAIPGYPYNATPCEHYRWLWESLNAANRPKLPSDPNSKRYARVKAWLEKHPDVTSWAANPWVWVIEFKRLPA